MVRTRDFLLFALTIVFLVMGISATVFTDLQQRSAPVEPGVEIPVPPEQSISASVTQSEPDRAARIASLKAKLAERESVISLPEVATALTEPAPEQGSEVNPDQIEGGEAAAVTLCSSYPGNPVSWPNGLVLEEREGARILVADLSPNGTTSITGAGSERVFLQIPIRNSVVAQQPNCIPNEVVGVAKDGLPIRNTEYGLFSVFGSETLVGYALDGYPIYGLNDAIDTDQCGGADNGSGYRYYLSSERDAVLGCFTAPPVSL